MCKHVFNAKVVFQASCCQRWFECSECHDEINDHLFEFQKKLKMFCKTCTRTFERDLKLFTVKDKYCYSCGTGWCVPGVTPESTIYTEGVFLMDDSLNALLTSAGSRLT